VISFDIIDDENESTNEKLSFKVIDIKDNRIGKIKVKKD
jgi:hypothetical protein